MAGTGVLSTEGASFLETKGGDKVSKVSDEEAWAAAHAIAKLRKEQTGAPAWFNVDHARVALEAARKVRESEDED